MKKKTLILLVSVLVVALCVTGGVWAALKHSSDPVENSFSASGNPTITIEEEVKDNTKSNVFVRGKDITAEYYVRAEIVITLKDESGKVLANAPVEGEDKDYTLVLNETDWQEVDGFYYYKGTIVPDDTKTVEYQMGYDTTYLINSCTKITTTASLDVDVLAQVIQKGGEGDAWNMQYSGGTWSTKSQS